MIKTAVFGTGHVGRAALDALQKTPDFELCGIVDPHHAGETVENNAIVSGYDKLPPIDAAILAVPSRLAPDLAESLLHKGVNTVDSFDIHAEIPAVWDRLGKAAGQGNARAVISAGWDPGTDSIVRALMEAMTPDGITYTNFGPGLSMGHTVAVKAIPGVADALSITIPAGAGVHRRMVYVRLEPGAELDTVSAAVKKDAYFANDETHVTAVPDVAALRSAAHGVQIERSGVSGRAQNQNLSFGMKIDNPALTAQVMVAAARAALRQPPGCYTLIELPVVDFLPGDRRDAIARLV